MLKATPEIIRFVGDDFDHPEGLNFGPDGYLYAGGEAGQIYRINPQTGGFTLMGNTSGFNLGVALDADANVYTCDFKNRAVWRISQQGDVSKYSGGTTDRELAVPNYCVFDSRGNLYVSDSGDYWTEGGTGCIFVVRPGGQTELFHAGPLRFANGLAIDPAEEYLYIIQSTAPDVVRVPLNGGRPTTTEPEVVVRMKDCVPDGLAFDAAGNLYISLYKPDQIFRLDPDGKLELLIDDPTGELLARPTNIALHNGEIYWANLGARHIGAMRLDVQPAPLHYPKI